MTNLEFHMGLKMALENYAQQKIDEQVSWVNKAQEEVQMYITRGPRYIENARAARRVLQTRQEILNECRAHLEHVRSLDITSSDPLPYWMGTDHTLTSLWPYMPEMFRNEFNRYYNDDLRHESASIIVDGTKYAIRIPD